MVQVARTRTPSWFPLPLPRQTQPSVPTLGTERQAVVDVVNVTLTLAWSMHNRAHLDLLGVRLLPRRYSAELPGIDVTNVTNTSPCSDGLLLAGAPPPSPIIVHHLSDDALCLLQPPTKLQCPLLTLGAAIRLHETDEFGIFCALKHSDVWKRIACSCHDS